MCHKIRDPVFAGDKFVTSGRIIFVCQIVICLNFFQILYKKLTYSDILDWRPCHGSGGQSPIQRPGLDTRPARVGFKMEDWQQDRVFSEYCRISLSELYQQCFLHVFLSLTAPFISKMMASLNNTHIPNS